MTSSVSSSGRSPSFSPSALAFGRWRTRPRVWPSRARSGPVRRRARGRAQVRATPALHGRGDRLPDPGAPVPELSRSPAQLARRSRAAHASEPGRGAGGRRHPHRAQGPQAATPCQRHDLGPRRRHRGRRLGSLQTQVENYTTRPRRPRWRHDLRTVGVENQCPPCDAILATRSPRPPRPSPPLEPCGRVPPVLVPHPPSYRICSRSMRSLRCSVPRDGPSTPEFVADLSRASSASLGVFSSTARF